MFGWVGVSDGSSVRPARVQSYDPVVEEIHLRTGDTTTGLPPTNRRDEVLPEEK